MLNIMTFSKILSVDIMKEERTASQMQCFVLSIITHINGPQSWLYMRITREPCKFPVFRIHSGTSQPEAS